MSQQEKVLDILVVDDDRSTLRFLASVLAGDKYTVTTAASAEQAVRLLKQRYFPVVLADIHLGAWDGLALLPYIKQAERPCLIIFLTGQGSMETAVQAMREGAFDYLSKPIDLTELEDEIKSVVGRAFRQIEMTEQGIGATPLTIVDVQKSLIGKTPQMVKLYRTIAKAALSNGNVLITGESGTGKELVARAIHENSARSKHRFVAVNCCALTETLLESELFGHVKGSFTGADSNKRGLFEEANGGTLFLDEIGDLSHTIQVKLLRALQEGEIRPVGANETRKVDVRVIAATHRNLDQYMVDGKFREDLYYRLKVFLIETPPLRDRRNDIIELASYFIARSAQKMGKNVTGISREALQLLVNYPWPGNIREMENAIERSVSMTNTTMLFPEDFPSEMQTEVSGQKETEAAEISTIVPGGAILSLEDLENQHIRRVLETLNFNKSKAAEALGIDRTTLYRKAARYGIDLGGTFTETEAPR